MKTKVYDTVSFPEWALSALINGDYSGISDNAEDCAMVEKFEQKYQDLAEGKGYKQIIFDPDMNNDSYFTSRPAFGLACNCVPLTIVFTE